MILFHRPIYKLDESFLVLYDTDIQYIK